MENKLSAIFALEDSDDIEGAFKAYLETYSKTNPDYEVWKHFYFFLWYCVVEDFSVHTETFNKEHNIEQLLRDTYQEGQAHFADMADFNWVAGYTISLFPYHYGDYNELEKVGKQMLAKAHTLEPSNPIYKMSWLGSGVSQTGEEYEMARNELIEKLPKAFSGNGYLDRYFVMFLDRKRFWIYSGSKVIGYSNLEKGDPSMGVSFGVFIPSKDYPSVENEVREAFAKNDFKNLALSAKQIRNGKIIDCVFISFTPPPVELPNEPIEITVGGIPHPEYSVLFPR